MRIYFFSWRDITNPRAGGAERVSLQHMRFWVRAGHQVTLLTAGYPNAAARSEIDGVRVVRIGSESTVHALAHHWYRRQKEPDVVVDEVHGLPFGVGMYAGVPVLAWIYEVARDIWSTMCPWPVAVAGRLLETALLQVYARRDVPFVTDSHSTALDLRAVGVNADRITVIEPGFDAVSAVSSQKEPVPTIIFVGRLVRMKGVEDALRALSEIRRQLPECRLWVVGTGEAAYEWELKRVARRLGLNNSVEFFGYVGDDEKNRRLQRAHLLIHPSRREGWGMNVIEANAMGTPAVGYRVPGLRDSIRHGDTGLLCPPGRPDLLADAAMSLLIDPTRYRVFQENARRWSGRFSWGSATCRSLAVLAQRGQSRLSRSGDVRPIFPSVREYPTMLAALDEDGNVTK